MHMQSERLRPECQRLWDPAGRGGGEGRFYPGEPLKRIEMAWGKYIYLQDRGWSGSNQTKGFSSVISEHAIGNTLLKRTRGWVLLL